jgi:hypothetical protein
MGSSSPETNPAYFGFTDLHGFKDFLVEVIAGAPDDFMEMDWLAPEHQMNLERAFVGLRYGLNLTAQEKGASNVVAQCSALVEQAYAAYRAGKDMEGQRQLEEVEQLLNKIPSH